MNEIILAKYLTLIKKHVGYHIKNPEHLDFKDDVVSIVFTELYEKQYFEKHNLDVKEQAWMASSYIKTLIKWRYSDYLVKLGFTRHSTVDEPGRTIAVSTDDIDSTEKPFDESKINTTSDLLKNFSPEQIFMAKQAYRVIKNCFESTIASVKDSIKSLFLEQAFWEQDSYGVPLNELAKILGYENSNPTQDFNRYVEKVSACTEPTGVIVNSPKEQIEYLRQIISADGGVA